MKGIDAQFKILLMSFSSGILIFSCAKKPIFTSTWRTNLSQTIQISNQDYLVYSQTNVMLKTFNNNEGILILIWIADEPTQLKKLLNDLSVWIGTSAKQNEKIAVVFPSELPSKDAAGPDIKRKGFDASSLALLKGWIGITMTSN